MLALAIFLPEDLSQAVHPRPQAVRRLVGDVGEGQLDRARLVDMNRADAGEQGQADLIGSDRLQRDAEFAEMVWEFWLHTLQGRSVLEAVGVVRGAEEYRVDAEDPKPRQVVAGVVLDRANAHVGRLAADQGPAACPQAFDIVDAVEHGVPDVGRQDSPLASLDFRKLVPACGQFPIPNCEKSPLSYTRSIWTEVGRFTSFLA